MFNTAEQNNLENDAERNRRQQLLRLGLIICLVFLLLDGSSETKYKNTKLQNKLQSKVEIRLPEYHTSKINNIIEKSSPRELLESPVNVTTMFRGSWTEHSWNNSSTNSSAVSTDTGFMLMPLKSVPVKGVSGMSFVYGVVDLYSSDMTLVRKLSCPIQGIWLSAQRKLALFLTPYKGQRIILQVLGNKTISTQNITSLTKRNFIAKRRLSDLTEEVFVEDSLETSAEYSFGDDFKGIVKNTLNQLTNRILGVDLKNDDLFENYEKILNFDAVVEDELNEDYFFDENLQKSRKLLSPTASNSNRNSLSLDDKNKLVALAKSMNVELPVEKIVLSDSSEGKIQVLMSDLPILTPAFNFEITNNKNNKSTNSTTSQSLSIKENLLFNVELGESFLPPKLKSLQSSNPSYIVEFNPKNSKNSSVLPSLSIKPRDCQYKLELIIKGEEEMREKEKIDGSIPFSAIKEETKLMSATGVARRLLNFFSFSENLENENSRRLDEKSQNPEDSGSISSFLIDGSINNMQMAKMADGAMSSENCQKKMSISAKSYHVQLSILRNKVDGYSLTATSICLFQIFLVLFQLRQLQTQAATSKISILSIFAQSLLDALLCLSHLLVGAAVPQVFFSAFVWVAIMKLLLFSVFQMRLIMNIYQARYAQEISSEGWLGFRRRMVQLHMRFYSAVAIALIFALSFPSRPITGVFLFYSYWIPQIIYSAYSGTKPNLNPFYIVTITLTRFFIPMYLLGCPKNFLFLFMEYFRPMADPQKLQINSPTACYVLVIWSGFQVAILLLQSQYGPRFFVPKQWLPSKYNYQRAIPRHLFNSNSPTSSQNPTNNQNSTNHSQNHTISNNTGAGTLSRRNSKGYEEMENEPDVETGLLPEQEGFECVVCYNTIFLNTTQYMITPCDHVFHEECLSQWMRVKLECPVCRAALPTLEE